MCDELEVKGLDVVRSSFPISFRIFMKEILMDLLKKVDKNKIDNKILEFREKIRTLPVIEIARNTSVKFMSMDGLSNYNPSSRHPFHFVSKSPCQCKAALAYNDMLENLGLDQMVTKIFHGQKIKYVYLKENSYGLEALAMKADGTDPKEILEFIEKYVDRKAMFEKELKSKFTNPKKEGIFDILGRKFPDANDVVATDFFGNL